MRRLLLTVVLLVVMAACFVPVYAEGPCSITFSVSIDDDDRALADGEYVYNVSYTEDLDWMPTDFDLTVVLENGKIKSMTSTAEDGFMTIRNYTEYLELYNLPAGDYLIKEKACPDSVRFQKLSMNISGQQYYEEEKNEARISLEGNDSYASVLVFSYVVKWIKPAITVGPGVLRKNAGMNHAQVLNFGGEGWDALTDVVKGERSEWKVTLKDERFKDFKAESAKTCDGEVLSVGYSGARVSSDGNCYISAVIANGSDVKYYGRIKTLKKDEDKAGKVLINVKDKLDLKAGDKLYVFNEQFNGDRVYKEDGKTVAAEASTDFSSDLKEVAVPKEITHDWKPATYTEPETCQLCGATRGTPLDPVLREPLDLRTAASTSGEGWAWDSASRTLTLSGMIMDLSKYAEDFDAAILLPDEGATIVVNEKTSTIALAGGKTKTVRDYNRLAVETKGDLKILGDGVGVLDIEATGGADGISADGSIMIGDSDKLKGPAVEVYGTVVGMCANKSIGVYGSTVEAGNTGSQDQNSGAIIAANFDKEPGGIIVDHSDLTVSAVGEGAAGFGAIYGDICLMDSSVQQTPVDGASEVDGVVTANGTVYITNSQAYFDLGSGDKAGGSFISAEYGDGSLQTNRDIYIKDSTVRGTDADTGLFAYFGGVTIKNSMIDLTTAGYSIDCTYKGLSVDGSTVDLKSTSNYFSAGARVDGPLTIKNSTFTAKASGEMGSGLVMNDLSKTIFSGKDTKISLEGTYSAIDFNNRKTSKDYPLTLKNNLTAKSGGKLQVVLDKTDKTYTWSYSASTLKAGSDGIMKNASKKVQFALGKANTLAVRGKTYKISAKELKKKGRTVKRSKVLKVKGAKDGVRYTKIKGNKKITINYKTGKVTLKKGLKKGKYKVTVKVFAAGNSTYSQSEKKATFTVVVKK